MSEQPPVSAQPEGAPPAAVQPGNGLAVAALVLGIVSAGLFCVWYVSIPAAILAIIFGVIGGKKAANEGAKGKGMAKAGIILGIVAIALVILLLAGVLAILGIGGKAIEEQMKQQQRMQGGSQPGAMLQPIVTYARTLLA